MRAAGTIPGKGQCHGTPQAHIPVEMARDKQDPLPLPLLQFSLSLGQGRHLTQDPQLGRGVSHEGQVPGEHTAILIHQEER